MTLEKKIVYRQQVDEFGNIHEQEVTQVLEGGEVISFANTNRCVIAPGKSTVGRNAVTIEIAKAVHTQEVIDAYEAGVAALKNARAIP